MRVALLLVFLLASTAADQGDAYFSQGLEAYAAEDYERAITLFNQAAEAAPAVSKYHHWLGRACGRRAERVIFVRAGGWARKAHASFERAVELDPKNMDALGDLFDYYLEAPGVLGGGEDKARSVAERLEQLSPAEGRHAEARILIKRKDYPAAEKQLRRALELEPAKLGRILELASFLSERGRYPESDAMFDRAAKLDPNAPELLFARGKQLVASKRDPEKARQLLDHYLQSKRQPDDPPPSEVRALLKKL